MLNKTTKINFSLGFIFFDTVKYKGKNICVRIRNDKFFFVKIAFLHLYQRKPVYYALWELKHMYIHAYTGTKP